MCNICSRSGWQWVCFVLWLTLPFGSLENMIAPRAQWMLCTANGHTISAFQCDDNERICSQRSLKCERLENCAQYSACDPSGLSTIYFGLDITQADSMWMEWTHSLVGRRYYVTLSVIAQVDVVHGIIKWGGRAEHVFMWWTRRNYNQESCQMKSNCR